MRTIDTIIIPSSRVYGHNELNKGKSCPSFDVQKWKKEAGL